MEFRLLGPPEAAEQDRMLGLDALKQRSLLQRLLHSRPRGGGELAT